jgi:hypothetical protein
MKDKGWERLKRALEAKGPAYKPSKHLLEKSLFLGPPRIIKKSKKGQTFQHRVPMDILVLDKRMWDQFGHTLAPHSTINIHTGHKPHQVDTRFKNQELLTRCELALSQEEVGGGASTGRFLLELAWELRQLLFLNRDEPFLWKLRFHIVGAPFFTALLSGEQWATRLVKQPDLDAIIVNNQHLDPQPQPLISIPRELRSAIDPIHRLRPDIPILRIGGKISDEDDADDLRSGAYWLVNPEQGPAEMARKMISSFGRSNWYFGDLQKYGFPRGIIPGTPRFFDFKNDEVAANYEERLSDIYGIVEYHHEVAIVTIVRTLLGTEKLYVEHIPTAGLSGGILLEGKPKTDLSGAGDPQTEERVILKLGSRFDVATEVGNYRNIIATRIGQFAPRLDDFHLKGDNDIGTSLSGARYSKIVELTDDSPRSVRELLEKDIRFCLDCMGNAHNHPIDKEDPRWKLTSAPLKSQIKSLIQLLQKLYAESRSIPSTSTSSLGLTLPCIATCESDYEKEKVEHVFVAPSQGENFAKWFPEFTRLLKVLKGRGGRPILRFKDWRIWEVKESEIQLYAPGSNIRVKIETTKNFTADPRMRRHKQMSLTCRVKSFLGDDLRKRLPDANLPDWLSRDAHDTDTWIDPVAFLEDSLQRPHHMFMQYSAIHGDLNLDNILLGKGRPWLLDFDRTEENAAIARDITKFEIEVRTRLLPAKLLEAHNSKPHTASLKAQDICLKAFLAWEMGFPPGTGVRRNYKTAVNDGLNRVKEAFPLSEKDDRAIRNILQSPAVEYLWNFIAHWRRTVKKNFGLRDEEFTHASFAYSISCLRFENLQKDTSLSRQLAFCLAGVNAGRIKRLRSPVRLDRTKPVGKKIVESLLKRVAKTGEKHSKRDRLALVSEIAYKGWEIQQRPSSMEEEADFIAHWALGLAAQANRSDKDHRIPPGATKGFTAIDMASTGSAGNKTPIIVAAILAASTPSNWVIPKAGSSGSVAGTIDIMKEMNAEVDISPRQLWEKIQEGQRLLFISEKGISTLESELFELRRKFKMMRHRDWVLISILAKKLAVRCHVTAIDIKVGTDIKVPAPFRKGRQEDAASHVEDAREACKLVEKVEESIRKHWDQYFPLEKSFLAKFQLIPLMSNNLHLRGQALGARASAKEILAALETETGGLWDHCAALANQIMEKARGLPISSEGTDGVPRVSERFEVVQGDREPRLKQMSGKINAHQMLSDAITGSQGSPGTSSGLPPFLEGVDHTEWLRKPTTSPGKDYHYLLNDTRWLTSLDLFGKAHETHKHTIYRIDPVTLESALKRLHELFKADSDIDDKDDQCRPVIFFVLDKAVTEEMESKGECNLRKLLGDREPDKVPILHYSWSRFPKKSESDRHDQIHHAAKEELSHLAARAFCFTQEDGLPPFGEHIIS